MKIFFSLTISVLVVGLFLTYLNRESLAMAALFFSATPIVALVAGYFTWPREN